MVSNYQAHSLHISRLIFNDVCDFIKEKNEKCIITCRNKVFKHQLVPCINSVKINNRNFLFQLPICPTSDTAAVGYCYNFTDPILCKVSTEKYFLKLHILKSTKFEFFFCLHIDLFGLHIDSIFGFLFIGILQYYTSIKI